MKFSSIQRAFLFIALVAVQTVLPAQTRKPLIGISTGFSSKGTHTLNSTYTRAIEKAGGIPVMLPVTSDSLTVKDIISRLDGILLSGGEDVQPAYYGEDIWNSTVYCNPTRDVSDILYARSALGAGLPILGICRGSQLMNVMLGGSLYQDIPSQVPGALTHAKGAEHTIAIVPGSLLHRLFGTDTMLVNSFHHQAVKVPGKGVTITAKAADGVVEAWEAPGITAFQFHPEKLLVKDSSWLPVFTDFISKCSK